MGRLLMGLVLAGIWLPAAGMAGGMASTHSLASGAVAVTNLQQNSSWVVSAVGIAFSAGASGSVAVKRESQGYVYTLAACTYVGATNLVWFPDAVFSFGVGDVLRVESTATNAVVQVMRKAD